MNYSIIPSLPLCILGITFLLPNVVLILGMMIKRLVGLRDRAWHSLLSEEAKVPLTKARLKRQDSGNLKRALGHKALLAGDPIGWTSAGFDQTLTHLPLYFQAVRISLGRLVYMVKVAVESKLNGGPWIPDTTAAKIYQIVITSPFILIAKHDAEHNTLLLAIPNDVPVEWMNGDSPHGLELVFDCKKQSILSAKKNGLPLVISEDAQRRGVKFHSYIFACLQITLTDWLHPKSHIMAERSAREIVANRVKELEPSSRFVVALHEALIYHPLSPIGSPTSPFHKLSKRDLLLEALDVPMAHDLSPSKAAVSPYFDFLVHAHEVMRKCVKHFELPVDSNDLFGNMVTHAIDHWFTHRAYDDEYWISLDGSGSVRSFLASQFFAEVWVPHLNNPFDEELLCRYADKPECSAFYRRLYNELASKDKTMADVVTMSCSW